MKVYPVVHINNVKLAIDEGSCALNMGADGIFLANHNRIVGNVFEVLAGLRERQGRRKWFIGINLLEYTTFEVLDWLFYVSKFNHCYPDAIWLDDVTNSGYDSPVSLYNILKSASPKELRGCLVFAGVAFRGTRGYTESPILAGREAKKWLDCLDVVATSSPRSSIEPSIAKLKAIKGNSDGKPIAVAGGITPKNIINYAGLVDHVLVSSSIEIKLPYNINEEEQFYEDFSQEYFPDKFKKERYSGIFDKNELGAVIDAAHSVM